MKSGKVLIVLGVMLLLFFSNALANTELSCNLDAQTLSDIGVDYVNKKHTKKTKIARLIPERNEMVLPDDNVVLQLSSRNCFESKLIIRDADKEQVAAYSGFPSWPYSNCNKPPTLSLEDSNAQITLSPGNIELEFVTNISFKAPGPGKYFLEVYDSDILLTSASFEVLDPAKTDSYLAKQSICELDSLKYNVIAYSSYPVIFLDTYEIISLVITGENMEGMQFLFGGVEILFLPEKGDPIAPELKSELFCTSQSCKQDFKIKYKETTKGVINTYANGKLINSLNAAIVELEQLKELQKSLERVVGIAEEYTEYYYSLKQADKARKWEEASRILNSNSEELGAAIAVLEDRNFKISDVTEFIATIKTVREGANKALARLSG